MGKLQKKKWIFLVVAIVLLGVWIFLGVGSCNSKPEALAYKFFKAYQKQNINKMVKCYAPELQKKKREELKDKNTLSELQQAAAKVSDYEILVGDIVYGEGEEANTAEAICAFVEKTDYDATSCTEFNTLTLVKVGNKWYIGE